MQWDKKVDVKISIAFTEAEARWLRSLTGKVPNDEEDVDRSHRLKLNEILTESLKGLPMSSGVTELP